MDATLYTERAFLHLPGIGPVRAERLHRSGGAWSDLVQCARPPDPAIPRAIWDDARSTLVRNREFLSAGRLQALCSVLHPRDRWRLLADFSDRLAFFDIETTGLSWDGEVTVIGFRGKDGVQTFVRGRDLDSFLDVLSDDIALLVSFNGSAFDVPWLERLFHLPELPCAHLDLRWICHHLGLTGGLKRIERELGIRRPPDLTGVDGLEAVRLWERWALYGDATALARLTRYCATDVLGLAAVTEAVLERLGVKTGARHPYALLGAELDTLDPTPPGRASYESTFGRGSSAKSLLRSRLSARRFR